MSKIIVDEERHETDGRDGGRWETVVGDRDILGSGQCHDHHLFPPSCHPLISYIVIRRVLRGS